MLRRSETKEIAVWDKATRVFHWALVIMVAVCWVTSEAGGALFWTHLISGYGILLLVLFRIAWGIVGGRHARFTDFVRGRSAVIEHARQLLKLNPPRHIGHNPLGGWMIMALLSALLVMVITGLFAAHDGDAGPYAVLVGQSVADAISEIHETLFNLLLFLIALHVAGVLIDSLLGRENLVRALITGTKRVAIDNPEDDAPEPSRLRLAVALGLAVIGLALVISGGPG